MGPSFVGLLGLLLSFAGVIVSVACLTASRIVARKEDPADKEPLSATLAWGGRVATILSTFGLTVCCGILLYCFLAGDLSIQYVLDNHSKSTDSLALLYTISGLWAGREGSLLFWAWLISIFNVTIAIRAIDELRPLDNMAVLVGQLVLGAFVGVMLFSETNMPFIVTSENYLQGGVLTAAGTLQGMNTLLEHWAMAIHPPTLFIGYAGLTVPFAYAVSALIINDSSATWVTQSRRYALFSWTFLTIGIGLGAVWAYVCLGWGGYWGWDPVENASLLSWLMATALIHSLTAYKQKGYFKRWSILCACLAFSFVIVGTFISRSGLVQSVHAFEGDMVSLVLFLSLIILSVVLGVVGLIIRGKSFADEGDGDGVESFATKDGMYYLNNVILTAVTVLLTYMTVSQALPTWMPLGGQSLPGGAYDAIARPLTVLYLLMMAVGPMMSWGKTDPKKFLAQAKIPAICAGVLFVALCAYFFLALLPVYDASVAAGGSIAEKYLEQGPAIYYNGLALLGFAVASLLFFDSLYLLVRNLKAKVKRASGIGSSISHAAMAVILVGLIGSSMYVTEQSGYMGYDGHKDQATETFQVKDYELSYTGNVITQLDSGDVIYQVEFDVTKGSQYIGHAAPSIRMVGSTQQQKLNASVISMPGEDLFVIYRGVSTTNSAFSLDVLVNPLIWVLWVGFGMLALGMLVSFFAPARMKRKE